MAKYNTEQKIEAVKLYKIMSDEGVCFVDDIPIRTVRGLCDALNISSQSIYIWFREFPDVDFKIDTPEVIEITPENKINFGSSFWMFLARNMEIANYRVNIDLLKVKIAEKLLEGLNYNITKQ